MIRGLALAAVLLLGACLAEQAPSVAARIAPGVSLDLPMPRSLGRDLRAVQFVALRHGGERVSFEAHVEIAGNLLTMICLDPAGRRLVTLQWDGSELRQSRAASLPDALRAENLLADLVLVYFPIDGLVLRPDNGVTAALTEALGERRLLVDGQVRTLIRYPVSGEAWSGKALVENRALGYEIEIHSTLVEP